MCSIDQDGRSNLMSGVFDEVLKSNVSPTLVKINTDSQNTTLLFL